MHAVEQAVAEQVLHLRAEQRLGRRRHEQHRAVAAVAGDDVGHVAGEQPIAVLLGIEQPEARARERFGAERKSGRVERRRDDAERCQRGLLVLEPAAGGSRSEVAHEQQEARRRRARRSRPAPPPGARPTARPRAARPRARSRRTSRCRRSRPRPRSPARSARARRAHARSRTGRCATGNRRSGSARPARRRRCTSSTLGTPRSVT